MNECIMYLITRFLLSERNADVTYAAATSKEIKHRYTLENTNTTFMHKTTFHFEEEYTVE